MNEYQSLAAAISSAADYVARHIDKSAMKGVITDYRNQLDNLVYDAFNHRITYADMRQQHKALLKEVAPEAFMRGMFDGGIQDSEIDSEDRAVINESVSDWLASQMPSVNGFAQAAYAAGDDKTLRADVLDREGLWVQSLETLRGLGEAYANENEKGQWKLGGTVEHCVDCARLANGASHRVKWFTDRGYIPRQNGSDTLECGGWQCECGVYSVKTGARLL